MTARRSSGRRSRNKAAHSGGDVARAGAGKNEQVTMSLIRYDEDRFEEKRVARARDAAESVGKQGVLWLNVEGVHDAGIIEDIGREFNIHPLLLEDIASIGQRPKIDDLDRYMFIVFKMLSYNAAEEKLSSEHVSVVLGPNYVISFQEGRDGDAFNAVRDRIRNGAGRMRKAGSDYLAYSLVDATVDGYFGILEQFGEKVEMLEEDLVDNPRQELLQDLHRLKRNFLLLRRSIWPLREVAGSLEKMESPLFQKDSRPYLRDLYDHVVQVIETVEVYRDMLSGMLDIYLSSISNRLNEVMKVLTVISTIFIPLNFMAGVYGMNFKNMPELDSPFGYPAVLCAMAVVAGAMISYFRRKGWY